MQTEQAQQRYQQGNQQLLSEHGVAATGQSLLPLWSARGNEQPPQPPPPPPQPQQQSQHGPPLPLPLPPLAGGVRAALPALAP